MTEQSIAEYVANQPKYTGNRRFLRWLIHFLAFGLMFKMTSSGVENIPDTGATILMMNHTSFWDPVVCVGLVQNRDVVPMSKAENKRKPVIGQFNKMWGVYYINRQEADRHALTSAIELLKSGQVTLIAPEGTRHPEGLAPAKDGIAYIASKSDAAIVPTAVCGLSYFQNDWKRLKRPPVHVEFGRAFKFNAEGRINKTNRAIMMQEAMYQLALTIPDRYSNLRGNYSDIENATTETLNFIESP